MTHEEITAAKSLFLALGMSTLIHINILQIRFRVSVITLVELLRNILREAHIPSHSSDQQIALVT